jgi:hypothetical protein
MFDSVMTTIDKETFQKEGSNMANHISELPLGASTGTSAKKIEAKPVDNAAWVQLGRMLSPLKIRVRRS